MVVVVADNRDTGTVPVGMLAKLVVSIVAEGASPVTLATGTTRFGAETTVLEIVVPVSPDAGTLAALPVVLFVSVPTAVISEAARGATLVANPF
jgi:hypothetical protein